MLARGDEPTATGLRNETVWIVRTYTRVLSFEFRYRAKTARAECESMSLEKSSWPSRRDKPILRLNASSFSFFPFLHFCLVVSARHCFADRAVENAFSALLPVERTICMARVQVADENRSCGLKSNRWFYRTFDLSTDWGSLLGILTIVKVVLRDLINNVRSDKIISVSASARKREFSLNEAVQWIDSEMTVFSFRWSFYVPRRIAYICFD